MAFLHAAQLTTGLAVVVVDVVLVGDVSTGEICVARAGSVAHVVRLLRGVPRPGAEAAAVPVLHPGEGGALSGAEVDAEVRGFVLIVTFFVIGN